MSREATALAGLRVLDLSSDVAGAFCARLFADNGADVVLVESAAGSPLRSRGPFARLDGAEVSCLFWHLNLGKRGTARHDDSRPGPDGRLAPGGYDGGGCGWVSGRYTSVTPGSGR